MTDFSVEKQLIRTLYGKLATCDDSAVETVLAQYYAPNYIWRGYHPFHTLAGPGAVAETFWKPLRHAMKHMQRREDLFMAGNNDLDDGATRWVVSMGHLMGLFDQPWLGIAPSGKMAFLRYCEFNKVEDGKVTETAMYFDIPHLMMQAGLNPFPPQTGAHLVQPVPCPMMR